MREAAFAREKPRVTVAPEGHGGGFGASIKKKRLFPGLKGGLHQERKRSTTDLRQKAKKVRKKAQKASNTTWTKDSREVKHRSTCTDHEIVHRGEKEKDHHNICIRGGKKKKQKKGGKR